MTGARAITASVTAQESSTRATTTRPRLIRSRLTVPLCAQCEPSRPRAVTLSANPARSRLEARPWLGQVPVRERTGRRAARSCSRGVVQVQHDPPGPAGRWPIVLPAAAAA